MGERWRALWDGLEGEVAGGVDFLRQGLVDAGPILDLVDADLHRAGVVAATRYDGAVLVLLQASALLERRDFPRRAVIRGLACGGEREREAAVGDVALKVQALLCELARKANPGIGEKPELAHALKVLRDAGLLPLTPAELARWREDEAEIKAELKRDAKAGVRDRARPGTLWEHRTRQLLSDPRVTATFPRYAAMLELGLLRNAYAHSRTRAMQGIDLPLNQWRRLIAFTALTCARAFAAGVIGPVPAPSSDVETLRRAPDAAERTEALIAVAEVMEETEGEPDRPRRGRRWFAITAAATFAVILGTVGANVIAPRFVSTAPPEATPDTGAPASETAATPDPSVTNTPLLAFAPGSTGPTAGTLGTRRCESLGHAEASQLLPPLGFQRGPRRGARIAGSVSSDRVGTMLQGDPALGSVVVLAMEEGAARAELVAALERAACGGRPVVTAEEALAPGMLVDDALIVATLSGATDPRVGRLLDLAGDGRAPRLLLATTPDAIPRIRHASTVLEPVAFDCEGSLDGVARLLGMPTERAQELMAIWSLLPRAAAKVGQQCAPPAVLRDVMGVTVVAAALARSPRPPVDFDGTWSSWVLLGSDGDGRGPRVPAAELRLRERSGELARRAGVLGVGPIIRRKHCASWADGLGLSGGDDPLLAHVVGTPPGRECLAFVLAAAADSEPDALVRVVERGLGAGVWRTHALAQAADDAQRARGLRDLQALRALLARLTE